jgi:hypothetical protein
MFISRPQTTHVQRSFTTKKTGNRYVDKENAGALPSKTPSKGGLGMGKGMLVPNTARPLGKARDEGKGKGKEDDIGECSLWSD